MVHALSPPTHRPLMLQNLIVCVLLSVYFFSGSRCFACMCVCAPLVFLVSEEARRGHGSWSSKSCGLPCGYWNDAQVLQKGSQGPSALSISPGLSVYFNSAKHHGFVKSMFLYIPTYICIFLDLYFAFHLALPIRSPCQLVRITMTFSLRFPFKIFLLMPRSLRLFVKMIFA